MLSIPMSSRPEQFFNIKMEGTRYQVRVLYNYRNQQWNCNLSTDTGGDLVLGLPLTGGVNQTQPFPHIPLSNLYVLNTARPRLDPSIDGFSEAASQALIIEADDIELLDDAATI